MSGHTPGPWSISRYSATSVEAVNQRGVASTGGYQSNMIDAEVLLAENEANARLIAAAPELLEALKKMLRTHTTVIGTADDGSAELGNIEGEWMPARAQAVKAIAKATEATR